MHELVAQQSLQGDGILCRQVVRPVGVVQLIAVHHVLRHLQAQVVVAVHLLYLLLAGHGAYLVDAGPYGAVAVQDDFAACWRLATQHVVPCPLRVAPRGGLLGLGNQTQHVLHPDILVLELAELVGLKLRHLAGGIQSAIELCHVGWYSQIDVCHIALPPAL